MKKNNEESWNDPEEQRSWADASKLMDEHSPHVLTAILAQHMQNNHGISETEAWGHASQVISRGQNETMAVLSQQIAKSRQSGRIK